MQSAILLVACTFMHARGGVRSEVSRQIPFTSVGRTRLRMLELNNYFSKTYRWEERAGQCEQRLYHIASRWVAASILHNDSECASRVLLCGHHML